jgi:hypothetical protein
MARGATAIGTIVMASVTKMLIYLENINLFTNTVEYLSQRDISHDQATCCKERNMSVVCFP